MDQFEDELLRIGELSNEAFSNNFLYTPITLEDFVSKYRQLKELIRPELVWLVEDRKGGRLQAFLFAIPDYLDPSGKTLIVKSMARRKTTSFKGIGSYIAGKATQLAKQMGFTKVIHAMMLKDNASVNVSEIYANKSYKAYTLYGKKL